MIANVGKIDRIIRAAAGLIILSLIFLLDGNARWWGLLGILPLATALFGYCPPYALMGITTCGSNKFMGRRPKM